MLDTPEKSVHVLNMLNALPGNFLMLLPDAPRFTIIGATDDYLSSTLTSREKIIGKGIFEAFPDNPEFPEVRGAFHLKQSLDEVIRTGKEHRMADQRYDVRNQHTGKFEKKVWRPVNRPAFDENGQLQFIIHWVEDITRSSELEAARKSAIRALEKSEANLRNTILQAPVAMCIMRGPDYVVEIANNRMLNLWGKTSSQIIDLPLFEAMPEVKGQGLEEILLQVYQKGTTYSEKERPVMLPRNGKTENFYINLVYQPLTESDGFATGIMAVAVDVTEQVVSRKKIAASEEEVRMAIEVADLGTFHVDLETNTGSYSQRIQEWFGFDTLNNTMDEIFAAIHPDDREQVKQAIEKTLRKNNDKKHDLVYRVKNPKNQQERYLRSFGKTYLDAQPACIAGIIQDITHQVLYQKTMEENEAELQMRVHERTADLERQKALSNSILEASVAGVMALDAIRDEQGEVSDFLFVQTNQQFYRIMNVSENIIGKKYLDFFPDSRRMGIFDVYRRVVETGEAVRKEVFSTNRGLNAWFDISVAKRGEDGIAVTFANVSAQREATLRMEQQKNLLDNILRHSPSGITVTEVIRNENGEIVDGRAIMANQISEKFTGVPLEKILNCTLSELDPALIKSPLFKKGIETLNTGESFIMQYFFEPGGRWLELSVSKMDDNRLINVFTDVTSIKETQLQLEKNLEELKRSNANLEEFAYAASHDMKEPIRKIHFFSDRLREKLSDKMGEEDRKIFERMENAAKRMGALIDDLLVYSHVSRGALLTEEIDLNEKVNLVLQDLELEIEEKGAVIQISDLPVVRGHRRQLQQLFQNLIGNALKYNKPGAVPKIQVRAQKIKGAYAPVSMTPEESEKEYYFIEVQDNGIGFEQLDAERIFNVFTRLHGNTEYRGTGVGLAIARKVAENHGGRIWAESQPGEGSVFKILLPVLPKE